MRKARLPALRLFNFSVKEDGSDEGPQTLSRRGLGYLFSDFP